MITNFSIVTRTSIRVDIRDKPDFATNVRVSLLMTFVFFFSLSIRKNVSYIVCVLFASNIDTDRRYIDLKIRTPPQYNIIFYIIYITKICIHILTHFMILSMIKAKYILYFL